MPDADNRRVYWRSNLRVIAALLGVWFVVTFGVAFFARDLNFKFFGWPFSFWIGSQGALVVYGLIIWYYDRHMSRIELLYGVAEED